VGNNWIEVEDISQTIIANGKLVFEAHDDAFSPLIYNAFPSQISGVITWTFDLNFKRTGPETTYAFWMQLGEGSQMSEASPTESGIAINLKWGGPNQGLTTHEGLAYVINGSVSQIATVSGEQQVIVQIDLDSQTYIVTVGGQVTESVPFENIVPIDTVRFFADGLNQDNFASSEIGNVLILRESDFELCEDAIDNDGDGDTDCLDSDCEGLTCNDGNSCTESDTCSGGLCAGIPLDCDDTNDCTDDSCIAGQCVNQCNAIDSDDSCCSDSSCTSDPLCIDPTDTDSDGIPDDIDNCPTTPNGPNAGTCTSGTSEGDSCMYPDDCNGCVPFCSVAQEDEDTNGIGDVCDI
jgi:hypothetical protein